MKMTSLCKIFVFFIAFLASSSGFVLAQNNLDNGKPEFAPDVLRSDIKLKKDYTIVVNGTEIKPDVPPVERDGVIFVPLRFVTEALNADVSWNQELQRVTIKWEKAVMVFEIGKNEVDVSGKTVVLPTPPFLHQGRTMVPLKVSAQGGGYQITEKPNVMIMNRPADAGQTKAMGGTQKKPPEGTPPGLGSLNEIRKKAHNDQITKKLRPYIIGLWMFSLCLWLLRMVLAFRSDEQNRYKDKILILLILAVGVPLILSFMLSTVWAAAVAIGTCIVGLVSTETFEDKIVTMANSAQGFGLICTLFGLGLLIGPAIAARDIHAIGYGIYVKIEPTITGLSLSILFNMIYGYEARKRK